MDKFLQFLKDNKDALDFLFGSGIFLAILGGLFILGRWIIKEVRLRRIRSNENFPFKIIPPNRNIAKEILGGADDDPLADRNIPCQQRIQGRNTRRELEELIEDNRWLLITGGTGLGKTREAVQLAQSLNNEGWTVLYLTREVWLDAPAKLPTGVPERKVLFFLDDLNKKCHSSKAEIRPDANESLTLPISEPFQTRLQRALEAFDTFCGKSEIRVIATARNEKTSEFDEPSEWDKLGWLKHNDLWEKFKLIELSEPDKLAEQKLLAETAEKANILIESEELPALAKRNDGTFRNLIENLSSSRLEGFVLSKENFRDTLQGTWKKRYQRAIEKYPEAIYIYDAIELISEIGVQKTPSIITQTAKIISRETFFQRIKSIRKYSSTLKQLIRTENLLNPRDGQLNAKGYRVNKLTFIPLLYFQIAENFWQDPKDDFIDWLITIFFLSPVLRTPKHFFLEHDISTRDIIYNNLYNVASGIETVGKAYNAIRLHEQAIIIFRKLIKLREKEFNSIFSKKKLAKAWYLISRAYYNNSQSQEAKDAIEKSILLNSKSSEAWLWLGEMFSKANETDDAVIAYQKAIGLKPKNADAWLYLGSHYRTTGRYEDARKALETAGKIQKSHRAIWNDLGNVYNDLNMLDEAIAAYKKQINIAEDEISLCNLGITYLRKGLVKDAIDIFEKAIAKDKDTIYANISLATIHKRNRSLEKTSLYLEHAKVNIGNNIEYYRALYECVCENYNGCMDLLKIALEKKQTSHAWALHDPNFEEIYDNPRFKEIVGIE